MPRLREKKSKKFQIPSFPATCTCLLSRGFIQNPLFCRHISNKYSFSADAHIGELLAVKRAEVYRWIFLQLRVNVFFVACTKVDVILFGPEILECLSLEQLAVQGCKNAIIGACGEVDVVLRFLFYF